MSTQNPNIVIVNSSITLKDALIDFMQSNSDYEVIVSLSEFKELVDLPLLNEVDLVLVDTITLDERSNEIIVKVKQINPGCKFIAISMFDDKVYLKDFLKMGFSGVVSKNKVTEELIGMVSRVMNGLDAFPNKN